MRATRSGKDWCYCYDLKRYTRTIYSGDKFPFTLVARIKKETNGFIIEYTCDDAPVEVIVGKEKKQFCRSIKTAKYKANNILEKMIQGKDSLEGVTSDSLQENGIIFTTQKWGGYFFIPTKIEKLHVKV